MNVTLDLSQSGEHRWRMFENRVLRIIIKPKGENIIAAVYKPLK
jgi:hypothetical protein